MHDIMNIIYFLIKILFSVLAVIALLLGKWDYMIFCMLYVIYMELETIEGKLPDK